MPDLLCFGLSFVKEAILVLLQVFTAYSANRDKCLLNHPIPNTYQKPYEQMLYPGQRVQIDVKFVPEACIVGEANGKKFYQYTAIDEYSRFRYLEAFEEHSSYSSAVFLEHLVKSLLNSLLSAFRLITDKSLPRGLAALKKPTLTMFEKRLKELGIQHKLIRPYTPRHNGKVERSHL